QERGRRGLRWRGRLRRRRGLRWRGRLRRRRGRLGGGVRRCQGQRRACEQKPPDGHPHRARSPSGRTLWPLRRPVMTAATPRIAGGLRAPPDRRRTVRTTTGGGGGWGVDKRGTPPERPVDMFLLDEREILRGRLPLTTRYRGCPACCGRPAPPKSASG